MTPCHSCHAGCCRSFAVPVTGADIITIERRLGLSFWDFVCRWADPRGRIARNYAPHFFFPDEPTTPFVICLTHVASELFPETTKCRFLVEGPPDDEHPAGAARCGIYDARPAACRVFPTRFDPAGELVLLQDVPARGRSDDHPVYDLCPRPWETADLDPIQAPRDLAVAKHEMHFFSQLARVWNRAPQPWTAFPEFLHLVYANRIQRDPADEAPATVPFPNHRSTNAKRAAA
jgi:Fe-S-cluster containining protein